jgi:hypothetical protein
LISNLRADAAICAQELLFVTSYSKGFYFCSTAPRFRLTPPSQPRLARLARLARAR